jgi:hypothetical protein
MAFKPNRLPQKHGMIDAPKKRRPKTAGTVGGAGQRLDAGSKQPNR